MIDVWHTLDAILPDISKQLRDATKDHPEHPIQAVDGWQYLMNFLILEDTPINGKIATENWQRWSYVSIEAMDKAFQQLAEQGYAEQSGDTFTIAEKGCDAYLDYFGQREEAFAKIVVLSEADFVTFINFFKKGYEAAKLADNPPYLPGNNYGYQFYGNLAGGQLGAMLGWINLFEIYRDDTHVWVWKQAGFTGIQIESLTKIWYGEAHNAVELAEILERRAYQVEDYQQTLDTLLENGLVQVEDNHYSLTEQGIAVREQIEVETNQIYQAFCEQTYTEEEAKEFQRVAELFKGL